jgi:methionine-rich copper-binding protein CopC
MTCLLHRWSAVTLTVLALTVASAGVVSAHAEFKSSVPAPDSTVATAPETVTITFTEEVKADGNTITVTDAAGKQVDTGAVTLDKNDADRTTLIVALNQGLSDGLYSVEWKNNGADGHSEEGNFTFTVDTAATGAAAPASRLPATGAPDTPFGVLFAGAVVVIGLGLFMRRGAQRRAEAAHRF